MTPARILVVEDEAIVAMDIRARLELAGFEVVGTTGRGDRALVMARELRPDLVLMDIRIQGERDGIEIAAELRSTLDLPIVFLTSHAESSTLARARATEPFGYVLKPFEDRELRIVIEMALYKHAADAELRHMNRLYAVLSQTNQAIVRISDAAELAPQVCRLACTHGQFPLVWIATYDDKHRLEITAVDTADPELRELAPAAVEELGSVTPRRDAWATQPVFHGDVGTMTGLHSSLLRDHGLRDFAVVPISIDQVPIGVLGVNTRECGFFGAREIALLEEMALDVGFALGNFVREAERRRVTIALAEREATLRVLADNVRDILVLVGLDGRFVYLAPSFGTLGYEPSSLVGEHALSHIHPDDVGHVGIALQRCLELREPQSREFRYRNADGMYVWFEAFASAVVDPEGRVAGAVVTSRDITERRAAIAAVREREERLRGLYEHAPIGIYRVDHAGRWLIANPAAIRMLGFASFDQLNPGGAGPGGEALARVHAELDALGEVAGRLISWQRDGVETFARVSARAIRDDGGTIQFFDGTLEDVTTLRLAEREHEKLQTQLAQAQRLETVGQLAGGVAHDFNNILAVFMMTLSLLRTQEDLSPDSLTLIDDLDDASARAADLTRQLLMFGRRSVLAPRTIELDGAIESLLKLLRRLLGEDIQLLHRRSAQPLWIHADPGMVDQLVTNLCVNARDSMPSGGPVTITTAEVAIEEADLASHPEATPGAFACLTVADRGHGMDDATLARIFEPFFTTKQMGKGTGLGLATVHGIVKQHGGWIEVTSSPGHGSTFRVYLPMGATGDPQQRRSSERIAGGTGELLLLVEDDERVLRSVAAALEDRGFTIEVAANAAVALQKWELLRDRVQLLLTDMIMPGGMTGLDLAERLRADRADLPVVIFSGHSPERLLERGRTIGGVTYLPKPCMPDLLARVIGDRLAGR